MWAARNAPVIARWVMRRVLPFKERPRRQALEEAITAVRAATAKYQRTGFSASLTLSNIGLYLLLAERDIQAVKIEALTHPDPWTRSVAGRVILLTMCEWDMDKVSGSKLRRALEDIKARPETRRRATAALESLRQVQESIRTQFRDVRNATIAHRDPDALLQYRLIERTDPVAVMRATSGFYAAADDYIRLLPELVTEAGELRGLLRQLDAERKVSVRKSRQGVAAGAPTAARG